MSKRRKLKAPIDSARHNVTTFDRRASDLPFNAKVAVVEIDDPYGVRDFASDARAERTADGMNTIAAVTELRSAPEPKVSVVVSLRDDPLQEMLQRGNITRLQFMAGRRYSDDCDTSVIGGARGIDYERPCVDGGGIGDPISLGVQSAFERLARADKKLGKDGKACCRAILGERLTISQYAARCEISTKYGREKLGRFLKVKLDVLAEVYGLAGKASKATISGLGLAELLGLDNIGCRA